MPLHAKRSGYTYGVGDAFTGPHPGSGQFRVGFRYFVDIGTRYAGFDLLSGEGACQFFDVGAQAEDVVECEVGSAAAPTGRLAIHVQIDDAFVGEFVFGIFIPGTSIQTLEGTIDNVRTVVTAPTEAALPSTGGRGPGSTNWDWAVVAGLAVTGLLALGGSALLRTSRPR